MSIHRTSTQQYRAAAGLQWRLRMPALSLEGLWVAAGNALDRAVPVPHIVNQTKLAIVAVMLGLDRPVSSVELQMIWAERKELSIVEYHLSTLVSARVAEIVVDGSELRFRMRRSGRRLQAVKDW